MSAEIKWGRKMESVGDNLWSHDDDDDVRTSLPHLDKSNGCTCISGCTLLLAMYNVN